MLLQVILWIVFGALAGWIASLIMGTERRMGAGANIVVGILGAFIGGFLFQLVGGSGVTGFNFASLIISVVGAVILLAIVRLFSGNHRTRTVPHA